MLVKKIKFKLPKECKKLKKGYLKYLSSKNLDKNLNQKKSLRFN